MHFKKVLRAILLLEASSAVTAHSWVEQVRRIDSTGAFTGETGRPIGYKDRTMHGFSDAVVQNKILDTKPNPAVCLPAANAYASISRLTAAAGDYVALVYQENGHVTQPFLTPRPYRDGIVNVYGTMHHQDSDGINDVLNSWTADGKGGNGKGQLLATHYYDDGQCYQNLGTSYNIAIYADRLHKYGLPELFCQTDFQLPADLPETGTYTIMWVWDWPLITSDTTNVTEIYTSCAEIQLEAPKSGKNAQLKYSKNHPIQSAGIESQLATMFEATGLGIGTNSPAAPSATSPGKHSATTDASTMESSAESSTEKQHGGVKTVVVTAAPQTTTAWRTVTVGASAGTSEQSEISPSATSTSSQQSSSGTSQPAPTTDVPVKSVSKFLKARVTGRARREGDDQP
ncbi:hypothetical protein GGR54DRAFT_247004 [Hypoxylon sp. NC1633]|nr:hypothetical protein GGR54DRAFT_247004 [Hypoxylon sp. NC1633]